MSAARLAATRALVAVERGRTTLSAEVEHARADLDTRDRAFLLELVAGTLRWQAELDACLQSVSRQPIGALDEGVRATLRAAAYQLRHLDRVPVHAVVHESVEVVRAVGAPRAAGFVNAVLRSLVRRPNVRLPPRPAPTSDRNDLLKYLSVTLSHPEWLADRWLARYGFEAAERWCQFNNEPPQLIVRAADRRTGPALIESLRAAGVEAAPAAHVEGAARLPAGALGRLGDEWRDALVVQEEASQLVAHAARARPGDRVLDVCAAPGGKTAILAAEMDGRGLLVASDQRRPRVALLTATLRRLGVRAAVLAVDATAPLPFGPVFDAVLLDAPCSGLGVLRRDPDLKWSRRLEDLAGFAAAQTKMLDAAARVVRPGGRLTYATCSSEPEENELVVDAFVARHPEFTRVPVEFGGAVRDAAVLRNQAGFLQTTPFEHGLDAFFAATLEHKPL